MRGGREGGRESWGGNMESKGGTNGWREGWRGEETAWFFLRRGARFS